MPVRREIPDLFSSFLPEVTKHKYKTCKLNNFKLWILQQKHGESPDE